MSKGVSAGSLVFLSPTALGEHLANFPVLAVSEPLGNLICVCLAELVLQFR
jgi:hypothetical protein